jgi:hypothetical protein
MAKVLVLYVFHIFNERVQRFIDNAIFEDSNVDFIMVSNDRKPIFSAKPLPSYVQVFYRENIGYDFGGWSDAILTLGLYEKYDQFIFVNSSVIGPFLPADFSGKWTDIYLNGLQGNVKLFGSTINSTYDPMNKAHVQSYIFAMDKEALQYLIRCEIFSTTNYAGTFDDAIWKKEVLMSRKIVENGWNIGSLLKCYIGIDFSNLTEEMISRIHGFYSNDIMYNAYRNVYWNEYELVFIKGNRGIVI